MVNRCKQCNMLLSDDNNNGFCSHFCEDTFNGKVPNNTEIKAKEIIRSEIRKPVIQRPMDFLKKPLKQRCIDKLYELNYLPNNPSFHELFQQECKKIAFIMERKRGGWRQNSGRKKKQSNIIPVNDYDRVCPRP